MVNPQLAKAIEQLDYRVTVGDVATQAGLEINTTQSGLLALASDVGANLQVSDSGEIAYLFPRNYRSILRNKYFRLRLLELWQKIWAVLFYLIRISFGIFLVVSIVLIFVAIAIIVITYSSSQEGDRRSSRSFRFGFGNWIDLGWWFSPDLRVRRRRKERSEMNFFEAVFSVLFGDGNPNADLEDQRWQKIGRLIRQHQGAIVAEQALPYLDLPEIPTDEDYMIPILSRFNGYPEVTDQGQIIYYFPELQTRAVEREATPSSSMLREQLWQFSRSTSGQVMLTLGLGGLNLTGALVLNSMLQNGAIALGGFVGFVGSILWILLAYGVGFLAIPLGRYLWIQRQNKQIQERNDQRLQAAIVVQSPSASLQQKLEAARAYRNEVVLSQEKLIYTTEIDLIEQAFDE